MRTSTKRFLTGCLLAGSGLAGAFAAGCGGGSGNVTAPSAVAAPPRCTQSTLFRGSGKLPARTLDLESFAIASAGRVDVTLDWTYPATPMLLQIAQGACSFEQWQAGTCSFAMSLYGPPKPLKGSVQLAPGTYPLLIGNAGDVEESVSVQVVLSSPTCPASASASASGVFRSPRPEMQARRSGSLHP